jgi:hypothetical protein
MINANSIHDSASIAQPRKMIKNATHMGLRDSLKTHLKFIPFSLGLAKQTVDMAYSTIPRSLYRIRSMGILSNAAFIASSLQSIRVNNDRRAVQSADPPSGRMQ